MVKYGRALTACVCDSQNLTVSVEKGLRVENFRHRASLFDDVTLRFLSLLTGILVTLLLWLLFRGWFGVRGIVLVVPASVVFSLLTYIVWKKLQHRLLVEFLQSRPKVEESLIPSNVPHHCAVCGSPLHFDGDWIATLHDDANGRPLAWVRPILCPRGGHNHHRSQLTSSNLDDPMLTAYDNGNGVKMVDAIAYQHYLALAEASGKKRVALVEFDGAKFEEGDADPEKERTLSSLIKRK